MTQLVKQLVKCNRCNAAGHTNEMIGFVKTDKRKSDGKMVWDLVNAGQFPHIHKSLNMENIEDIQDKVPPRPPMEDPKPSEITLLTAAIKELTAAVRASSMGISK